MKYFSLANTKKPQNKTWKFISKFLTRTLPVYAGIIAVIPDTTLSADTKVWITVIFSAIVATISSISELTAQEEVKEEIKPDNVIENEPVSEEVKK